MTPELIYWVVITGIGVVAAIGAFALGLGFLRRLDPDRRRHYWPENVRDSLLVVGLTCNTIVGILASNPSSAHSPIVLLALLGGATCMSAFAVFNFLLRIP